MVDKPMSAYQLETTSPNPADHPDVVRSGSLPQRPATLAAGTTEPALPAMDSDLRQPIMVPRGPRREILARQFEREILPRLAQSHSIGSGDATAQGPVVEADIASFARLVVASNLDGALAAIAQLQSDGVTLDRICLELLAPAARRLGALWDDDRVSFTDVTVGLGVLHRVLHLIRAGAHPELARRDQHRTALLATAPGEQHSFGLTMAADFFRRAGWEVSTAIGRTEAELTRLVRDEWVGVIGLSVSTDERLDGLATLIRLLRRASANGRVAVLVGGKPFETDPGLAVVVGADAAAGQAEQAVMRAEGLLMLLKQQAAD